MLDATDTTTPRGATLTELEAARAECVARVEAADAAVQSHKARVTKLSGDHGRLNTQLVVAQAQSEAARLLAFEEVLENSDCNLKEIARSLNAATGPEGLILRTRDHLLFEVIPAARVDQLRAMIALRLVEWQLSQLEAQIHEAKLVTALGDAVLLEGDLEITGAASRRYADLVALRGEAHKQAEAELQSFLVHQEKLRVLRVQAGLLSK
jgi:hypothetical protein